MPHILTIDLLHAGSPQNTACYAIKGADGVVIVDPGPHRTIDTAVSGLKTADIEIADVKHVLVTHVHLDHGGASWWWAQQGAQIHVHQRGAAHLINPEKLLRSAGRIFGDQMHELWGDVRPIDSVRVSEVRDGDVLNVCGLEFRAIETPGHARHHHAYAIDDVCFTGDAAGLYVPPTEYVCVPSPPPEFDLHAWYASIDRLDAEQFGLIYPTHFGAVQDPAAHFLRLRAALNEHAKYVRRAMEGGRDRDELVEDYRRWQRAEP